MGGAEIHLDGKEFRQSQFCILNFGIPGDGNSDSKIRMRITAGANSWRKVERRKSCKVKGKELTPSIHVWHRDDYTNPTEKQPEKVQV